MTTRHACANMPTSYRGEHVLHRGVRTARKVWQLAWHAAAAPNARRKRPNSCAHSHAQPDNPTRTTHTQAHAPCAAAGTHSEPASSSEQLPLRSRSPQSSSSKDSKQLKVPRSFSAADAGLERLRAPRATSVRLLSAASKVSARRSKYACRVVSYKHSSSGGA